MCGSTHCRSRLQSWTFYQPSEGYCHVDCGTPPCHLSVTCSHGRVVDHKPRLVEYIVQQTFAELQILSLVEEIVLCVFAELHHVRHNHQQVVSLVD
ncbi:hypothetical protein BaRGS_00028610 [Batillaria attramentaria]|uniref:Uncharacterized protein n=1 Tax=Batillaria attramentaria TaxID=370345 RepID=A0ABD0JYL1_9CAEN